MDFLFLWLMTLFAGFWILKKIMEWRSLPPGPWGWPILGYLPFIDGKQPHITLTELSKRYGPIYGIKMGNIYAVILSNHKLVREAFAKENLSGRAPLYLTHGIMHGMGIICAEGALWKDQRKLITSWLKSFGMSKYGASRGILEGRIAAGALELLENVEETPGIPIDLSRMLTNSLGNVINEIIFGFKFPPEDKTWNWCRQIQEEGCHEMGVAGIVNFLPFARFFSPSIKKTMEVISRGQAQTHRLYASIINRRRKMLKIEQPNEARLHLHKDLFKEHPKGFIKCVKYSKRELITEEHYFDPNVLMLTEGDCILDNFLIEQKKRFESEDKSAQFTTDEQMHYLLADLFGAGLDTTSVTLSWFLLYMALYPEEQEKVRKEIVLAYCDGDEANSSRLPYLMAAICETQRIRSIVPVGIPHGCVEDTFLRNYRIPKGAMVIPLQWAIHMDPNVWEDPEEFRPSRFLSNDGKLLKPQEFIPFQTGKRMCPGDELSRMLACGFVARLFRFLRVSLADEPPSVAEMQGTVGLTLAPPSVLFYCDPLEPPFDDPFPI